jgi:hypothetical protein
MIAPTDVSTVNSHKDLVEVECPCFSELRLRPSEAVPSRVFTSARWFAGALASACGVESRPPVLQSYRPLGWWLSKLITEAIGSVEGASAWTLWSLGEEPEVEFPLTLQLRPRATFTFSFVLDSYVRAKPNVVVD